jgi:hypothetical protein
VTVELPAEQVAVLQALTAAINRLAEAAEKQTAQPAPKS